MRSVFAFLLLVATCTTSSAQLPAVRRYNLFAGFSYFPTPSYNLYQRGFNITGGANLRRWVAFGGDFSVFTGRTSLSIDQLTPAQQARFVPLLPLLPPGYVVNIPYSVTTSSYAAGMQFNYQNLRHFVLFARPVLGAMHQSVHAKPSDAIQSTIVAMTIPHGDSDTVLFTGFGGGFDIRYGDHFGFRVAADYVHMHLFSDLLRQPQNSVRLSVGPVLRFGRFLK